MSDVQSSAVSTPALDIEERASLWLQRRYFWDWKDEDQAELDVWLASSLAHRVAYVRLETAWKRTKRLAALRTPGASQSVLMRHASSLKIAAFAIVLALLIGSGTLFLLGHREQTYVTAVGGHQTITLANGSRIELGTDTVLRMSADRATASLDKGEAYFQIKHDAMHPFVVIAGDRRVTDLGTKFLIRHDTERLEVALMEGRVKLDGANGNVQPPALLKSGDEVIATANTMFITRQSTRQLAGELGWRRGVLVFDNTTLADAAAEFNRYNHVKMLIADQTVARLTIDGTFPTTDVQAFTAVAQRILGLRTAHYGDEIVISR